MKIKALLIILFCNLVLVNFAKAANQTSVGWLEGISNSGNVRGWVYDPDAASQSSKVQFFIDGTDQSNFAGETTTSELRTDVNSNYSVTGTHGFNFSIPNKFRDNQQHTIYAYAVDINDTSGLSNIQILNSPQTFALPVYTQLPIGYLEAVSTSGDVVGWAYEPGAASQSIKVQFFLDNTTQVNFIGETQTTILRTDVNTNHSISGNHGFIWSLPVEYWDGKTHKLYVFAVNPLDPTGLNNSQLTNSPLNFNLSIPAIPPPIAGHIKYFGYFANAGLGGTDSNFLNETYTYNNLAWIQGPELSKIAEAKSHGMKSIVDVTHVFFDPTNWRLIPWYQDIWNIYKEQLRPYIESGDIAALYVLDEPYMNGLAKGTSYADMHTALTSTANTIKTTFPDVPVATIFEVDTINNNAPIPTNFDWLGIDCYDNFYSCGGHSIPWYYEQLKTRANPNVKFIIVPQGIFFGSNPSASEQTTLINRWNQFIAYAESEPKVIAIVPFIYQTPPGNPGFLGAKDIPSLKSTIQTSGASILASIASASTPPPAPPIPPPANPQPQPTPPPTMPTPVPPPTATIPPPFPPSLTMPNIPKNIKLVNDAGTYYLIQNGKKFGITNPGILNTHGFNLNEAQTISTSEKLLEQGSLLTPADGSLVKSKEDKTVYLISKQKRYAFTSSSVFLGLGFKFSSVLVVTNPELQILPKEAELNNSKAAHLPGVDIKNNGTIYWVGNDARLYPYPNLKTYNSWHLANDFTRVVNANAEDLKLPISENVTERLKE